MSDLVINVRQISNYPALAQSDGTEQLLLQQGGLGGPYASIDSAQFVASALNQHGPALGVGVTPAANAAANQIFTGSHSVALGGGIIFNAYTGTGGTLNWGPGISGSFELDPQGFFVWELGSGTTGQPVVWSDIMQLSMAGSLSLPMGTLAVARDPATDAEVATLGWVQRNTAASFNNRTGPITLVPSDIYSALQYTSAIATEAYVNQSISNALLNYSLTCQLVTHWNGRWGDVFLNLSDITCVFYQPGQQPISPTPPATSSDDSIATTAWITQLYAPAPTLTTPPTNPTSGQLWWDATDGNLYVWYNDGTSSQWVSAFADAGGGGAFLPLSGGTVTGQTTFVGNNTAATVTPFLYAHQNASGAYPSGTGTASLFAFNVDSDTVDATNAQGGGLTDVYFGSAISAGAKGGRTGLNAYLTQTGATTLTSAEYYVATAGFSVAGYSAGGTSGAPIGALFGSNFSAQLNSGATNWLSCVGQEINIGVSAPSVQFKAGFSIVQWAGDVTQGALDDCALMIANQTDGTAPGWKTGIEFGGYTGWWPFQANSTMIGTKAANTPSGPPMAAENGIDFSAVTFGGNAFASTGFSVNGSGVVTADGGTMNNGLHFGSALASSPTDLSRHIELYGGGYAGLNVTSGSLNYVTGAAHTFYAAGTNVGYINSAGLGMASFTVVSGGQPTITGGAGAPSSTQPSGSIYLRTGGATGTRLYVSAGGGTWAAVAGV